MESKKKMIQTSLQNRNRLTDFENELMAARGGEGWREGIVKEFEMDMYTQLCLKWIPTRTYFSTWNSAD